MALNTTLNSADNTAKENQKCFLLHGITWLPHYKEEGVFVSPSNKVGITENNLKNLGATETTMYLWKRNYGNKK